MMKDCLGAQAEQAGGENLSSVWKVALGLESSKKE